MSNEPIVTKLTPEQEAKFPEFREKWLKRAFNCDPANFNKAKDAVLEAYKLAEQSPPKYFYNFGSPLAAVYASSYLLRIYNNWFYSDKDFTKSPVTPDLPKEENGDIHPCIISGLVELKTQMYNNLLDKVLRCMLSITDIHADMKPDDDQISLAKEWVKHIIVTEVRLEYIDTIKQNELSAQINNQLYGNIDGLWLCFYDFFADVCDIEECRKLDGLMELAQHCGWWLPFDEVVILQDKQEQIHFNDNDVLHNEDGPAIAFRDGFKVYMYNNMAIPASIITEPENQTLEEINEESNEEIKRFRIEKFGWENYLEKSKAKVIDTRHNDVEGVDEALMTTGAMTALVCACPSTARVYSLEVPTDITTCVEAQKWLASNIKFNCILGV